MGDNKKVIKSPEASDTWSIVFYESPTGNPVVLKWFRDLDPKVVAKFSRIFELLEEKGTEVGEPYVKSIKREKLHEVRVSRNKSWFRILYFAYASKRFILLHGFQKQGDKIPKKEIDTALERKKEFLIEES